MQLLDTVQIPCAELVLWEAEARRVAGNTTFEHGMSLDNEFMCLH